MNLFEEGATPYGDLRAYACREMKIIFLLIKAFSIQYHIPTCSVDFLVYKSSITFRIGLLLREIFAKNSRQNDQNGASSSGVTIGLFSMMFTPRYTEYSKRGIDRGFLHKMKL